MSSTEPYGSVLLHQGAIKVSLFPEVTVYLSDIA